MSFKDYLPYVAVVISLIALYFTVSNYKRKSSVHVKGIFSISSSVWAEDSYVSNIVLENYKDRAVIIFKIFLRVGPNYYIEVEDLEHSPLVLKAYESYAKQYDPVDFYCLNMGRVKFNHLFRGRKAKLNLVLSTSHGKYVVKDYIKRWDPVFDTFKNGLTANVLPMRPHEKVGYYGYEYKYLVKLFHEDGTYQTMPIYPNDDNYPRFNKFILTTDSLSSRENLEAYLTEQAVNGNLKCSNVEVLDAEEIRKLNYRHEFDRVVDAKYFHPLFYFIVGRVLTIVNKFKFKCTNRQTKVKSRKDT